MTASTSPPTAAARGDAAPVFRRPTAADGVRVHDLVAACPPLDANSLYCNLLQCTHFADTSIVAERDGELVGWVSGYRRPDDARTLFVWQVAVHESARGTGLGRRMLLELLDRLADIRWLHATVTPDNDASRALFRGVARASGAPFAEQRGFERATDFGGRHASERLIVIGPIPPRPRCRPSEPRQNQRKPMTPTTTRTNAAPPGPDTFERLESGVRSYSRRFPAIFDRAQGPWLFARDGTKYLDFLTGCSSLNYGHNPPALKQALLDYIERDGITHSLDLYSDAKGRFLAELSETVLTPRGLDYVAQFPGPTGANAVEAAIKLARKVTGRRNVIAFTNGFHGVTLGALACTGNRHHRGGAGTGLDGVTRMPYDGYLGPSVDTAAVLDTMLSDPSSGVDAPAAILLETVQGEGGLNAASAGWLRAIEGIARRHGALLIVDDVQAGVGRTGTFFSFEPAGIRPDLVTLAKSLSGYGLPLALLLIDRRYDRWLPGEHNGTFRGNCHAFVTARAALETFWRDPAFEAAIEDKGRRLGDGLAAIARAARPHTVAVRGRGMMRGLALPSGEAAARVVAAAFDRGLVIETGGPHDEVVKCLAPLTVGDTELDRGLAILGEAVEIALAKRDRAAA
ncbi:MAG TPA: diaminobutyrate--2-oxoglutarate transaminase [Woeseiaceae bacterium]|nr:diaminobutyrate--2-oxoglutarate transaminase [Woeseiaceae bacterium]